MRKILFILLALSGVMPAGEYLYHHPLGQSRLIPDMQSVALRHTGPVNDQGLSRAVTAVLGERFERMAPLHGADSRRLYIRGLNGGADLETVLAALRALPGIRQVMPVFKRGNVRFTVTERFIVRFYPGTASAEINRINRDNGVEKVRQIAADTWLLAAREMDGLRAAGLYGNLGAVQWAQPNVIYLDHSIFNSNDTYYASQWAHKNTGQTVANGAADGYPQTVQGFADADMDVDEAWTAMQNQGIQPGEGILIGVIDSGIELAHPDLKSRIADPGRDFTPDNQKDGNDIQGHGTAVAGVLAAEADNGLGVAGIAPYARLLPVKINSSWGSADDAGIAEAIDYAWQFGSDVLTNSWSGTDYSQVIADALNRAKTQGRGGKGCVIVFSSGNEGHGTVSFPARLSDVIAVGASNMFDEKKNQGSRDFNRKWGGNYGAELDLVAPTLVYTTDLVGQAGFDAGDYKDTFGGTSASCPHVSATAALILSVDPALTSDQVQEILQASADKIDRYMIDAAGWNKHVGYGRVNALQAVQKALGLDGDAPSFQFDKPLSGTDTGDRSLTVNIRDESGMDEALLFYRTTYRGQVSGWKSSGPLSVSGSAYSFSIPGQQWETMVEYYFFGRDKTGREVTFPIGGDSKTAPPLPIVYHVAELNSRSYASADVPVSWENANTFYSSTLDIKDDFSIVDVNATVDISGQIQDFAVALEAPSGVAAGILQLNPGTAYSNTTTDDEAKTPITDGADPYAGSFQPDNAQWVFDGERSAGSWKLTVYDDIYFNNGGSIKNWSLELTAMKDNPVPVVSDIPGQTIDEGGSFTSIDLNAYVSDGNHADSEISWSYSGNTDLLVSIDANNLATVSPPSANWSGSETITFTASDPGAATDSDAALFTVNAQNDPPVVSDIPDQTIAEGQSFATIALDDYVSDPDNSDAEMNWTYSGNSALTVSISAQRVATVTVPDSNWNGAETITFTATDPGGLSDSDGATFTVTAVNDAPVVSDIPGQTVAEGNSFATISLDDYVSDVDNADSEMNWSYSGNSALTVSISPQRVATIGIPDDNWNGAETITFTASDPGGLSDSDGATFTVTAVNDAPLVSGIPNQSIDEGQSFATIPLDDYVSDVDNADSEMSWSYSGNNELTVSISAQRVATVTVPDSNWNGSETITFTATDPGGLSNGDAAVFSVGAGNDPPTVSDIPDQTIAEGNSFATIILDDYVSDVDNADSEMNWSYSGNSALTVSISAQRVATVTVPDSNWNGSETITFTATDPGGLSDSDGAIFKVSAVNDAPVVSDIPGQTVAEGNSFATISLDDYVSDVDNTDSEMNWSYSGNSALTVSISPQRVATIAIPDNNWNGSETIIFTAADPDGLTDSDGAVFTVSAENDAPRISTPLPEISFAEDDSLLWPDSQWYPYVSDAETADADLNYTVKGNGTILVSPLDGGKRFSAVRDWFGSDTLMLRVDDGMLADSALMVVRVAARNDAPLLTHMPDSLSFNNSDSLRLDLRERADDVDTPYERLSWQISAGDSAVVLKLDNAGEVLTISAPDFRGETELFFILTDDSLAADSASVPLRVSGTISALEPTASVRGFELAQNYPNPFNPKTVIRYQLPVAGNVELSIYNILGNKVAVLVSGKQKAGRHEVRWDASGFSSGIYFYRLETAR